MSNDLEGGFWKPGTAAPGSSIVLDKYVDDEDASALLAANYLAAQKNLSLGQFRKTLPVYQHRREFLYALSTHRVVIVCGQTGSGKTTQLPQYLLEAGYPGIIACTQPRRVATISIAERVAEELETEVGGIVGYAVRFEDISSDFTKIKYMTDGVLFREAIFDPLLEKYCVIMIDEAHERSLHTDLLLGLLKKIIRKRKDVRIVISSASMDAEAFARYFASDSKGDGKTSDNICTPVIMCVEGRMHPVEIFHLENELEHEQSIIDETAATILKIHINEGRGDILAFLPGKDEIEKCQTLLLNEESHYLSERNESLLIQPLYASLPREMQMGVFERAPSGRRKVILSTNIAETSVTIDGVVFVVDSGLVKQKVFNPQSALNLLVTTHISQASAHQRAGRAGRVKPGKCFRIYTHETLQSFEVNTIPEIQKCDLTSVVLHLKALGIENILTFDWMSPPTTECTAQALETLFAMHAIDDHGRLTKEVGLPMTELPLDPMLSRMLLASNTYKCGAEASILAAMLSAQPIFINVASSQQRALERIKRKLSVCEGDLVSLVNIYRLYHNNGANASWCRRNFINGKAMAKATRIQSLLVRYMERYGLRPRESTNDVSDFLKCITAGLFPHAALAQSDGSFRMIRSQTILYIHPNSVLFRRVPSCVLFYEVVETTKVYMRDVTVIDSEWLAELCPNYYEYRRRRTHR